MRLISEKKEKSIQHYEVEVSLEKVEAALAKAFREVAKRISLPGFRKGKAPRGMIERRYGAEIFYDEAIDALLPTVYEWVLEEYKPDIVDKPEVGIVNFSNDAPAVFTFAVAVKPDVIVGQYKGIEAYKPPVEVTDAMVDAEMQRIREEHGRLITLESGVAELNDSIVLDFEGFVADEPFEGGKGEDYSLVLGSGRFIPGFEEQLIGCEIGVPVEVQVVFPEDYRAEHLAGKEAVFKCKIKEAKRKELQELDDDFAQEISEFDTLSEWRENLTTKLRDEATLKSEEAFKSEVLRKVTDNAQMDVPEVMIERQIDQRLQSFSYQLQRQGITLEDYISYLGRTMADIREEFRDVAESAVRQMLTIEAICKAEAIEATEEQLDEYLKEFAKVFGKEDDAEFIATIRNDEERLEDYRDEVRIRAAVELIMNAAIPLDTPPAEVEQESEQEVVQEADTETEQEAEEQQPQDKGVTEEEHEGVTPEQ